MIILGLPITIWLGFLTLVSLIIQVSFGIALHVFGKDVFGYHRFFGFFTLGAGIAHATLAVMYWFFGVLI